MHYVFLLQVIGIPLLSPLLIGVIRKVKARMQNRVGASMIQAYQDLAKLLRKDEVISRDASWIFSLAPYLLFAISLVLAAGIPVVAQLVGFAPSGDLLVIIYLIALSTFILAIAALDTGSPFGGLGASREMTLSSIIEGGLLFSLLSVALATHSTNLSKMAASISQLPLAHYAPIAISLVAFAIALLAETSRYPFDNPSTHLELTMVHEASILEYSGKRLALIEWASYNKLLIFILLGVNLFLPWGGALIVPIKVLLAAVLIATLESTTAKLRFFRLPDLLFTSFVLGVIASLLSIF